MLSTWLLAKSFVQFKRRSDLHGLRVVKFLEEGGTQGLWRIMRTVRGSWGLGFRIQVLVFQVLGLLKFYVEKSYITKLPSAVRKFRLATTSCLHVALAPGILKNSPSELKSLGVTHRDLLGLALTIHGACSTLKLQDVNPLFTFFCTRRGPGHRHVLQRMPCYPVFRNQGQDSAD